MLFRKKNKYIKLLPNCIVNKDEILCISAIGNNPAKIKFVFKNGTIMEWEANDVHITSTQWIDYRLEDLNK